MKFYNKVETSTPTEGTNNNSEDSNDNIISEDFSENDLTEILEYDLEESEDTHIEDTISTTNYDVILQVKPEKTP